MKEFGNEYTLLALERRHTKHNKNHYHHHHHHQQHKLFKSWTFIALPHPHPPRNNNNKTQLNILRMSNVSANKEIRGRGVGVVETVLILLRALQACVRACVCVYVRVCVCRRLCECEDSVFQCVSVSL